MATTSEAAGPIPDTARPRRRSRRVLWRTLGALAVVLVLAFAAAAGFGAWRLDRALHASYPQTSGTLRVAGLGAPVTVDRDAAGIPQIYAADPGDLFLAEGYVQAQDRFWQMDVSRHYAAGTLASVLGAASLAHDELARALDWRSIATRSYESLRPQTKAYLQAFAQGVNDYLAARPGGASLSIEYSVLGMPDTHTAAGYRPARWNPVDTLSWLEAAAWDGDGGTGQEISRALLSGSLSRAEVGQLYPADGADTGFDAWAVSGKLTASGAPLLAAAPVAPPALPSAWYQIGLHCTDFGPSCPFDVTGYTQPGVPGVLVGHDRAVAWSWTGRAAHNTDLYLEKLAGSEYSYDGRDYPLTTRKETFEVADGSPVTVTVRETRHGPLLSDVSALYRGVGAGHAVSVASSALAPNTTADALFALDQAGDWSGFTAAAAGFSAPAEGMVYADEAGNIGYQGPAAVPQRAAGDDGEWPVPGWTSAYAWGSAGGGYAAPVQEYDPPDGYIAAEPGTLVGVRAARTSADLSGGPAVGHKIDAGYLEQIQDDAYDPEAAVLVPYLLHVHVDDFTAPAVALLENWDFTEPAGSGAAAYYNAVWAELVKLVIGRQLPQAVSSEQLALDGSVRWDAVINSLLTQSNSTWWGGSAADRAGRGSARDAVLSAALEKARLDLTALMGKDVTTWTWGRVHTVTPQNQALGVGRRPAVVKWLLDGPSLELPGGGSDVAAAAWDVGSGGFAVGAAPALRMVVDLAKLDASRWIGQTGESGHVDDAHYLDQAGLWAAGETEPWPYTAGAVRAATAQRLTLEPRG
ncbi:MAG TPA: penicillin acylase family protein [Actinospica sp.]|nr:penicillin acylase family protein [Actinospica sp.]